MLLQKFTVQGYKNLTQSITFGPLGQINVIHGPNNVGKSNLLQVMDLFFGLREFLWGNSQEKIVLSYSEFEQFGYPINHIFNLTDRTIPIDIIVTFSLTSEQQKDFKLEKFYDYTLQISLQVNDEIQIQRPSSLTDIPIKNIPKFILHRLPKLWRGQGDPKPFVLLDTNRRMVIHDTTPPSLHIVPQQLRDALFDAKESREAILSRRWELFVETMQEFEDIVGVGHFNTAFDRQSGKADLVFDMGDVRIPVDLLGSGIQQIVALLGQLILTPAIMIGIEEPELNLRYPLQKRLLKAFKKITQSDYGPQQLFLTSHSPAFEAEETFFAMNIQNGAPTLTQKPRHLAWMHTGLDKGDEAKLAEMYANLPEPVNYVSSEGLVMLPENLRQQKNLKDGGGVSFIPNKETGRFELWTTEELDHWLSGDDTNDANTG